MTTPTFTYIKANDTNSDLSQRFQELYMMEQFVIRDLHLQNEDEDLIPHHHCDGWIVPDSAEGNSDDMEAIFRQIWEVMVKNKSGFFVFEYPSGGYCLYKECDECDMLDRLTKEKAKMALISLEKRMKAAKK